MSRNKKDSIFAKLYMSNKHGIRVASFRKIGLGVLKTNQTKK
jgi:hypothetical protein